MSDDTKLMKKNTFKLYPCDCCKLPVKIRTLEEATKNNVLTAIITNFGSQDSEAAFICQECYKNPRGNSPQGYSHRSR